MLQLTTACIYEVHNFLFVKNTLSTFLVIALVCVVSVKYTQRVFRSWQSCNKTLCTCTNVHSKQKNCNINHDLFSQLNFCKVQLPLFSSVIAIFTPFIHTHQQMGAGYIGTSDLGWSAFQACPFCDIDLYGFPDRQLHIGSQRYDFTPTFLATPPNSTFFSLFFVGAGVVPSAFPETLISTVVGTDRCVFELDAFFIIQDVQSYLPLNNINFHISHSLGLG